MLPHQIHPGLPGLVPDLASAIAMVRNPQQLFRTGADLHPNVFAFRVAWERWTIVRGAEAHRFFFGLTPDEVDPFHFRMRMPTLALPGVRPPRDMVSSTQLTKGLLAELFQRDGIDGLVDTVLDATRRATPAYLSGPEGTIDDFFGMWLELCALGTAHALLGPAVGGALPAEFTTWYREIEEGLDLTRLLVPWWPSASARRASKAMGGLIAWLRERVAERRRPGDHPDDLLQGYVRGDALGDRKVELDDDEIVWTVNSVQWAAHHYPAVHAFWAGMEIIANDVLRERLLEEQARHPVLDAGAVREMPLLQGCIFESLRLHPLVALPRLVVRDLEFEGTPIPSGSVLAISPYLAHVDAEKHDRPDQFDPERWTGARMAESRKSFIPGGGGRWGCVGLRLSVSMLTAMWAHVLRAWDLALLGPRPSLEPAPMLMPPSRQVPVRFRRLDLANG